MKRNGMELENRRKYLLSITSQETKIWTLRMIFMNILKIKES